MKIQQKGTNKSLLQQSPASFLWWDSLERGRREAARSRLFSAGDLTEAFFLSYVLLGFLLFPNNFPWT